ncbi:MAG: flagellar biosynthesis protein FliQ [Pseudomonadota bacterium]
MTPDTVIALGHKTLEITAILSGVVLLPALLVGLVVSILQTATSINESTLTFIPKLVAVAVVLVVAGPWMLNLIMDFTEEIINSIPELIG